jgi:tetratricopeptide (TPR) repeat protein
MIVRDEEEMLPRCLAAVAPAVDEIVIVDTGSQDRTVEIARSFGATVIEREWTGSFSDARNVSFEAAGGDWLIYLDADEVLVSEDVDRLRALAGHTWREAIYFVETNFTGDEDDGTAVTHNALRMFRNRPWYRFEGRLHEQVAQHLPAYLPERLHQSDVRIEHYGYLGVVRDKKEKSRRNIELLLAQRAESGSTPFLHFNLGSEYAAAGDAANALAELEQSWRLIEAEGPESRHPFVPTLAVRLVKTLRFCDRPQEALQRAAEGLERFPGFTDLVFEQAAASLTLKRERDAVAYFERCIAMGDASAKYTALVGCGTYLPRIALAELHLRRGELDGALERLQWCVEHHPEFFGTVHPYATALLRAGRPAAEVAAEVERRISRLTPTVRFMLATALFEAGAAAEAETQFRAVLAAQPASGAARVALAEALLYQRRNAEAADAAAAIAAGDPLAAVALRSELFGRLTTGDLDGAADALTRATAAGLPTEEATLFSAWLAQRRDEPGPVVPRRAAPMLEVMLEALLRVQDFAAFEGLHALVARSELSERERRELLGGVYLRRGFLKSAAAEWMAVCQHQPDAPALLGLARVSLAGGMPDEACVFAAEALVLDPSCQDARSIVEAARPALAA